MVLGSAPWKVHEPDSLFDRLIRETSMVFFYDQMTDEPGRRRFEALLHCRSHELPPRVASLR